MNRRFDHAIEKGANLVPGDGFANSGSSLPPVAFTADVAS